MNNLYTNTNINTQSNYNYNVKKSLDSKAADSITNSNEASSTQANKDVVDISQTNKNIINKRKAKDALDYTLKDYSQEERDAMVTAMSDINFIIKTDGGKSPLGLDLDAPFSFQSYADDLIKYGAMIEKATPGFLPANFTKFCEQYKDNLYNFGCD